MAFDSLQYALFLIAVVFTISRIRARPGALLPALLVVASFIFYAFAGFLPLAIFALSILLNQGLMERMGRAQGAERRAYMVFGVVFNLLYLFSFKYAAFFQGLWGSLGQALGCWQPPVHLLSVVLPIGISFYTFESLSILADVYKGRYAPPKLLDHALFVSFFPHLIAGPILRGGDFLPRIRALYEERPRVLWQRGASFLTLGLFKKLVLADTLALYADPVFNAPGGFSSPAHWLAALAFAFQIYFDFSAYSDLAEGSAALLGLRLAPNFRGPYAAVSMGDFWRRWHLSLSAWLRDYLYIPLGGSRQGPWRAYAALFVTMLLGGLWHGANLTFVAWGAYHGALLAMERAVGLPREASGRTRTARQAITFCLVLVGWILFRSPSLSSAGRFFAGGMAAPKALGLQDCMVLLCLIFCAWFHRWESRWETGAWERDEDLLGAWSMVAMQMASLASWLASSQMARPFIYFQF